MQMHAKGPGAGWSWLVGGFTVARQNPAKILGAAGLFMLCMAWSFPIAEWLKPRGTAGYILRGGFMLVNSLLLPILMGGFMRVLDASRNGRPVRISMMFDPFRRGQGGPRLALFGLCMLLVYAAFMALLLSTVGHDTWLWYLQLAKHQAMHPPVNTFFPLPHQISATLGLMTVFFLFYSCANAVGVGQAALQGQSTLAAFRDGIVGAFKNALPVLVLFVCGLLVLVAFCIGFGILVAIATLLAHVSGSSMGGATGSVLKVLVLAVCMLLLYAFMAGVNYAIWHDVANAERTGPSSLPAPDLEG